MGLLKSHLQALRPYLAKASRVDIAYDSQTIVLLQSAYGIESIAS